jgi:hypothetical protein
VGGKPDLPGISIRAPHTPQNKVVIMAYTNHGLLIIEIELTFITLFKCVFILKYPIK